MNKTLEDLISEYYSISIIGMSKNSGKTTVLNYILNKLEGRYSSLALTSIGRDGEEKDIVTNTEKPSIYVKCGTIIATAKNLMKYCDITKEIVSVPEINTPMGEIVIIRALSDGYVQIGGPSIGEQLTELCNKFKELNASKIFVDGALSRKSLASPTVTEGTILCAGASYHKNMEKVIEDTCHTEKMLLLNEVKDEKVKDILHDNNHKIVLINEDYSFKNINVKTSLNSYDILTENINSETSHIFLRGAVLDDTFDKLLRSVKKIHKIKFIVEDGSKIFIKPSTYNKLLLKGSSIEVLNRINLIGINLNPMSPYGYEFDIKLFKSEIEKKVSMPVFNVFNREEEICFI